MIEQSDKNLHLFIGRIIAYSMAQHNLVMGPALHPNMFKNIYHRDSKNYITKHHYKKLERITLRLILNKY
jgi:hypothetical protein